MEYPEVVIVSYARTPIGAFGGSLAALSAPQLGSVAIAALKARQVDRIILTRPAVEAGEHLGFLPGDLKEKIDPYLTPLYDALHEMLPPDKLHAYREQRVVEIAPLAYMRGRTLNSAYVILDEAQNATSMQMKMCLTRL